MENNEIKFNLVKPLPHDLFDSDALKVYHRLRKHNFLAYFVGGCVRDLLLGNIPKDFDIVTSARPRQIRRLFHNSRIIGRRFRLVNIFFEDNKIIEVATFRRAPWKHSDAKKHRLLADDNCFGSDEEDAMRRDFTINALFYAPDDRVVVDYTGGLQDLQYGKIRTIGDAKIRLAEDPVRIIRAIKFSACLGFDLIPCLYQAISQCSHLLEKTPSARILLEILKVLRTRKVYFCFDFLTKLGVLSVILPDLARILLHSRTEPYRLLHRYFRALDALADSDRTELKDSTLLTIPCLAILLEKDRIKKNKISQESFDSVLNDTIDKLSISKRLRQSIRNIICLQYYFDTNKNSNKIPVAYVEDVFEAVQVLKIRMLMGDASENGYNYWKSMVKRHSFPDK